jgi:excisionase family DNA binding protein
MSPTKTDTSFAPDGAAGFVPPLTITIATARQITGLGNTTLWKLIAEKKLQTVRIGRRRLVVYDSLRALLAPRADTQPQSPRRGRPRKAVS